MSTPLRLFFFNFNPFLFVLFCLLVCHLIFFSFDFTLSIFQQPQENGITTLIHLLAFAGFINLLHFYHFILLLVIDFCALEIISVLSLFGVFVFDV